MLHNYVRYLPCICALAVLAACASAPHEAATIIESTHQQAKIADKVMSVEQATTFLRETSPYADFAEATYRRDFPTAQERIEHGCDYVSSGVSADLKLNLPAGWQKLDRELIKRMDLQSGEDAYRVFQPCRSVRGLEYETYILIDQAGRPSQAVVAFRGTENTKYQWRDDWIANFSTTDFGLGSNKQFNQARDDVAPLVRALARHLPRGGQANESCKTQPGDNQGRQAPVYLVGHSLGGGLAQHLAFFSAACDVKKTITFDPSPATGWFFLHWRDMVVTADPAIERIYLDGEILSFLRKVSTQFNLSRENRKDYRVTFHSVSGGAIGLHSMTLLAAYFKIGGGQMFDDTEMVVDYPLQHSTPTTGGGD